MKTPEEIKNGLECCSTTGKREECAYAERCAIVAEEDPRMWFGEPVMKDALAYIQQLERERDAAVEALCEIDEILIKHNHTGTHGCMNEVRKTANECLIGVICARTEVE